MIDEGTLDPWVADWLEANPVSFRMRDVLEPARSLDSPFPVTREVGDVRDEMVDGVLVRIYEPQRDPSGLIVYFHGGAMCIGSVGIMDNVAREITHATGAVVLSVNYRLAPEHPFPAGLDDCEAVTRWALANTGRFGVAASLVVVAGGCAAGPSRPLSPADCSTCRSRRPWAVLIYPAVDDGCRCWRRARSSPGSRCTRTSSIGSGTRTPVAVISSATRSWLRCMRHHWSGCLGRSSSSAGATSCATRVGCTPPVCARQASRPRGHLLPGPDPRVHEPHVPGRGRRVTGQIGTWVRATFDSAATASARSV